MAALPATAPAKPKQPRKVLVLGKAAGFVHSSIPLAGRTIEEMGKKTGAWTTTITYDPADINEAEPEAVRRDLPGQHDRRVPRRSERRRGDGGPAEGAARLRARRQGTRGHPRRDRLLPSEPPVRRRAGRRRRASALAAPADAAAAARRRRRSVAQFIAQGDKNGDQKISREEFGGLADAWYDKLDTTNAGRVSQADFAQRFAGR